MNKGISGLGSESPQGTPIIGPKRGTGRSKSLGGVTVINKTTETTNSPISEAGKSIPTITEAGGKSVENRTVTLTENETFQYQPTTQKEYSIAGTPTPPTLETPEEQATTTDLSDDIASLIATQRKKSEEELKTGLKKRTRGSEEDEEIHKDEQRKITEGQATGEREENGEEKRREDFFKLLERMAREGRLPELVDIINLAWGKKGIFADVTHAYDALRGAQQYFSHNPEELIQNLSISTGAAADVLYKENGPDIRAGFIFGPETSEADKYRLYVLRFEGISETFASVMEKVQGNSKLFSQELDKLIKLIQIDLKSQESTLDPAHLQQIMSELYKVQICSQIKSESDMLLRDMATLYPPKDKKTTTEDQTTHGIEFSKSILHLARANWVEANSFNQFVEMVHIEPGPQKVDFCQRFLALIKRLPDKLVDLEHRQKIIEAGQEYLEEAIQEEEEEL